MTLRGVIVLGVIAAALAALALFVGRAGDRRPPGGAARVLPAFDRAAVRRITIARLGQPPFALVPGEWRVTPGDKLADEAAVQDLLTALDFAESERTPDVTPEAAGLSPPRVVVTIETPAGAVDARLGHADASRRGVFVRVAGNTAIRVAPRVCSSSPSAAPAPTATTGWYRWRRPT